MTCSFARLVGSSDLELVSFRESKVFGVSDLASLLVWLALLAWSGFACLVGSSWLVFSARAGHHDPLTCQFARLVFSSARLVFSSGLKRASIKESV
jgi:hypothetical protein